MTRIFLSSILAISLAFTSLTAVPAQAANNKDLGRFLAGAVALAIIASAIEDSSKKKSKPKAVVTQNRQPNYPPYSRHQNAGRRTLPAECLFQAQTPRGPQNVYGKICLNEVMRHAKRLPQACERTVRVRYGRRADVYGANCLSEYGYRTAGRRR